MPMTPTLFTISGLATETGYDRRTVAKLLGDIPARGRKGKHDAWYLTDLLRVAQRQARSSSYGLVASRPEPPAGFKYLRELDRPSDAGAYLMATALVYNIAPVAASMAVASGAPMRVAYTVAGCMTIALMMKAQEIGEAMGFEPYVSRPDAPMYEMNYFAEANWASLAESAGEPVNVESWEKYKCGLASLKDQKPRKKRANGAAP